MSDALRELIDQMDLEPLEVNLFRGRSTDLGGKAVYGGQVVGQALVAASRTVENRAPHSLHAYFLLPGDMHAPIVYEVDRIRDGRSFSARRIQAIQHGRPILSMMASFQVKEDGFEHQLPMPEVPPPEALRDLREVREEWIAAAGTLHPRVLESLRRAPPMEVRPVTPWNLLAPEPVPPRQSIWFRAAGTIDESPLLHAALLAYASDFRLIATALMPHGKSWFSPGMIVASIDHAVWFHREPKVDEWLLYDTDSPSAQGARGMARGMIFDARGTLVATVAQEGLMRHAPRTPLG